jgi:short-subunit dehydrogenase
MTDIRGLRAVVTGASSGLGADFARVLAEKGCHLVLVARREDRLKTLEQEITGRHGVEVHVVPMDLGHAEGPEALHTRTRGLGLEIDILVNNAGFGVWGPFLEIPWERERQMLELDILALVQLTKLYARDMAARRRGWILQVASIGAFQPSPTYASYSAAKAFVLSFGEAIAYELRGSGVKVSVLSPGVTETEFLEVAGQQRTFYQRMAMMKSAGVARSGIEAMLRGRTSHVPGVVNKLPAFLMRFTPRQLAAAMASWTMTAGRSD